MKSLISSAPNLSCHIGFSATALSSGNLRSSLSPSRLATSGAETRPHTVEKRNGFVKNVVRRFAQSSIDHRGVPEAPGRVVTVIEAKEWHKLAGSEPGEEDDYVWGVAYRIDPSKEDEVRLYLEDREKNGYTQHHVHVYGYRNDQEEVIVEDCTIWIGRLDNPAFVGYEPVKQLARTIYERQGPSGPNKEYVYKLAESVRELYPNVKDDYLFELEAAVKTLEPST